MKFYMTFLENPMPFNVKEKGSRHTSCYPTPIFVGLEWMPLVEKMTGSFDAGTEYYMGKIEVADTEICRLLEGALHVNSPYILSATSTMVLSKISMKVVK